MTSVRIGLDGGYEVSIIQDGNKRVECALINPEGNITPFSSQLYQEPEDVHRGLTITKLITLLSRANNYALEGSFKCNR